MAAQEKAMMSASDKAPRARTLYIECTYTYHTDLNTGIQRVVRNIVAQAKYLEDELGMRCVPVIYENGNFLPIPGIPIPIERKNEPGSWKTRLKAYLRNVYHHLRLFIVATLPFQPVHRFLFALRHQFGLSRLLLYPWILADRLRNEQFVPPDRTSTQVSQLALFEPGDALLLLDSSWHLNMWLRLVQEKKKGLKIIAVVYDLIPIRYPQYLVPALVECFKRWLSKTVRHSDFFVAISNATREDLKSFRDAYLPNAPMDDSRFEVFHLGSELDHHFGVTRVRKNIEKVFKGGRPVYLMVGTIEPRKNHRFVIQAFDELWENNIPINLCIIGKLGWLCEEYTHVINHHPLLGKNLFAFHDASDTELEYCYRHAKALIMPSITEGFGLPIIEALQRGLPAFVSDIPVFREVGGNYVAYFDLDDPMMLAVQVADYEKTGKFPAPVPIDQFKWLSWEDSARQLATKVKAFLNH